MLPGDDEYYRMIGQRENQKIVRSTAIRWLDSGVEQNDADLTALTTTWAGDWFLWRIADQHRYIPTIVPWQGEGFSDFVEWQAYPVPATRVSRPPLNDLADVTYHLAPDLGTGSCVATFNGVPVSSLPGYSAGTAQLLGIDSGGCIHMYDAPVPFVYCCDCFQMPATVMATVKINGTTVIVMTLYKQEHTETGEENPCDGLKYCDYRHYPTDGDPAGIPCESDPGTLFTLTLGCVVDSPYSCCLRNQLAFQISNDDDAFVMNVNALNSYHANEDMPLGFYTGPFTSCCPYSFTGSARNLNNVTVPGVYCGATVYGGVKSNVVEVIVTV